MPSWSRLIKLNGGDPIWYVDPPLDAKHEVWFYAKGGELRIHSRGVLARPAPLPPAVLAQPVVGRRSLYKLADTLVVDVELRGDAAVLRRGLLNGRTIATVIAPGEVEATLAHYQAIGFKAGGPYNPNATKVTLREYRHAGARWTIVVDGASLIESGSQETPHPSRDAAIEAAERLIAAREQQGFALVLIELVKARHANPVPKPPRAAAASAGAAGAAGATGRGKVARPATKASAPALAAPAKRPVFPPPKDEFAAVDAAVARLRDLHARLPAHHFVAELIDPKDKQAKARVAAVEGPPKFFFEMHAPRLGRWLAAKPRRPRARESSWDYFVRTYGSITWILSGQADDDLDMFYCGNVSGGGWSCLEVSPDQYDTEELAEISKDPQVAQLAVFHGGWHDGKAFAFDLRAASPRGEHPIVRFDEGRPTLPRRPGKTTPFGPWLFARVERLTRIAERNLRELG